MKDPESRVLSYYMILPVVFLYFAVLFGIAPLAPQIHIQVVCTAMDAEDCESSRVSSQASLLNAIAGTALSVPSIITCGIYGSISDKYGRKVAILLPIVGVGILCISYCIAAVEILRPIYTLVLLISANIFMGLTGSYITFVMGIICFVSDATVLIPESRKKAYSFTEATIFAPQVISPVLTGIWVKYHGFLLPTALGSILSAVSAIYLLFYVPESLPRDTESRLQPLTVHPFQTLTNLKFLFKYKTATGTSPLPYVGTAFFLFFMAVTGQQGMRIVYLKHRFDWDAAYIGIYDGMEGLCTTLSMVFAPLLLVYLNPFQQPLKVISWIEIGYFFRSLHWMLFGIMTSSAGIFSLLPLLLLCGPISPYTRTILSNSVPHEAQAQIFSAFSAIEGAASLLAPVYGVVLSVLFDINAAYLIFEIMAFVAFVSFSLIWYVRKNEMIYRNLPDDSILRRARQSEESLTLHHLSAGSVDRPHTMSPAMYDQRRRLLSESDAHHLRVNETVEKSRVDLGHDCVDESDQSQARAVSSHM
mmetsp:Transcript_24570/g.36184  ORF Transcript_24570/g.36184 Transcript_24570/m.36184 type:complete len:531 (-) Transcript_24570:174-1766(-)